MSEAFGPQFQIQQQRNADILRQSGPRFSSFTERNVADIGQRGLADFQAFQAQTALQLGNQQLQTLLGAGQFAQVQGQQHLSALLPFIQQGLLAGGAASAPVIDQKEGFVQGTLLPLIGTIGGIGATIAGGG